MVATSHDRTRALAGEALTPESRSQRIIQPSNGDSRRFQRPVNPERFIFRVLRAGAPLQVDDNQKRSIVRRACGSPTQAWQCKVSIICSITSANNLVIPISRYLVKQAIKYSRPSGQGVHTNQLTQGGPTA